MSDYIPAGQEHEIVCNYSECDWGMGLAGQGRCSGHGNPRDPNCPKFTTEAGDYTSEVHVQVIMPIGKPVTARTYERAFRVLVKRLTGGAIMYQFHGKWFSARHVSRKKKKRPGSYRCERIGVKYMGASGGKA